ncbi:MAG TPA: HipA N-terminal domain-containing protein, partial [Caulobacteraceae bacterium]|nr:HipA N-terminal domain-containing protein [Caulobacteraceae bacterium]
MTTLAEVRLWGRRIGAVSLEEGQDVAAFAYDRAFQASGIEVAPLMMPLGPRVFTFPELSRRSFH